jgi:hypothetical protein
MVTTITGTLSDTERDAFVEGVNRLEATLSSIDLVTLSLSEVSRLSKAGLHRPHSSRMAWNSPVATSTCSRPT